MGQEQSFQCAQHHPHKHMDDVKACNEYYNNRGRDKHVQQSTAMIIQAHAQGLLDDEVAEAVLTGNILRARKGEKN